MILNTNKRVYSGSDATAIHVGKIIHPFPLSPLKEITAFQRFCIQYFHDLFFDGSAHVGQGFPFTFR